MLIIFTNLPICLSIRTHSLVAAHNTNSGMRFGASVAWLIAASITLFLSSAATHGNHVANFYAQRTQALATQSFDNWQRASADAVREFESNSVRHLNSSGGTKAMAAVREQTLRRYLSELVSTTQISSEVAHIPTEYPAIIDASDAAKKWTAYYEKAKNGLRPNVEYDFKSNARETKSGTVTLSEAHIENLKDNFDILMWYRSELDSRTTAGNHIGAKNFKLFLDHFVANLLKSQPSAPRISISTGSVDAPEWKLDERSLREQLIMAYRYLIAKYQIYPEYEQFGPADRELLITMMKIALLMGADMNPQWFQKMDVDLTVVSKKAKWKEPMADALEVLKAKSAERGMPVAEKLDSPTRYEEPCIIAIPPPRPKQAAKPVANSKPDEVQKIEIIVRPRP